MSKITVKHYLNKRLKPKMIDNKKKYPLYVRVNYKGTNTQYKSNAYSDAGSETKYFSEIEFKNNKNAEHLIFLEVERNNIYQIINALNEKNREIDFSNFGNKTKELSKDVNTLIDKELYNLFHYEIRENNILVPELFFETEYFEILDNINILNPEFDKELSNYYKLCKQGFELFYLTNPETNESLLTMQFFEWKYLNGKDFFLKFALDFEMTLGCNVVETKKHYKTIIKAIDKLIN